MMRAFVELNYNLKKDEFKVISNILDEGKVLNLIENFVRMQVGAGEDLSKANEAEEYNIKIELDFSQDIFYSKDDCGNKGLRDGILLRYILKEGGL